MGCGARRAVYAEREDRPCRCGANYSSDLPCLWRPRAGSVVCRYGPLGREFGGSCREPRRRCVSLRDPNSGTAREPGGFSVIVRPHAQGEKLAAIGTLAVAPESYNLLY